MAVEIYYCGVWGGRGSGHHCRTPDGHLSMIETNSPWGEHREPARDHLCAGFLDPVPDPLQKRGQPFGWKHGVQNGWTILATWDRSGDPRGGSHSSFVMRGELSQEEAMAAAEAVFPFILARIRAWAASG